MKKLLVLFIASSLSLFATIDGYDENLIIKAVEQSKKRLNDEISLTDIYVEENKTTPKGGKYVVFEYTLESDMDTKPYLKMFGEEGHSLTYCKMFIGDKLDNVIVVKLRQNGKVVAEYKADAKKCSSKLK
ncbi:hypothetical protein [Aliarcobacter cryaerophilus]|jgi:hypothetical protein|uniref:hypothetical protein n=1 Tax=Aliarcobacter cryaerophilus TaxID=28198 RepID=UPI000837843A|nr:hypothetical protein [Aliarcobacter cryaerophilus]MCT7445447.1 hypothetical protein [Aliarcobacter cryaerophilus]MCT7480240.1 hypothetical protein [Aliarcobacter cryaerophilus]MCT7486980.1 hypothetical protein [Aliarcobacter cryaerophilus]MCT7491460.1 hypothetical protein [Aliarcobacter cryaerophilus]MCT7514950.1 hypothetical protein [Aliarcobacter cryaerophilus]